MTVPLEFVYDLISLVIGWLVKLLNSGVDLPDMKPSDVTLALIALTDIDLPEGLMLMTW